VIALNPSNAEARMMYETVSVDLDHTSEALDHYFLAEPADPLAEEPLQFRACLLIWLGRLDEALTVIGNPAARTCQNVRTHNLLTDYYRTRGDLDRAVQEADLVINGHPPEADTPAAWKEAASAWRHILARNKEAERAILSKLEASPVSGLTLEFCGRWYADLVTWTRVSGVGSKLPETTRCRRSRWYSIRAWPTFERIHGSNLSCARSALLEARRAA
jgi:hypothetical protein